MIIIRLLEVEALNGKSSKEKNYHNRTLKIIQIKNMEAKKTTLEWIVESFFDYAEPYNGFSEEDKWTISEKDFDKIIELAKKKDKVDKETEYRKGFKDGQQYYKEEYGSKKN